METMDFIWFSRMKLQVLLSAVCGRCYAYVSQRKFSTDVRKKLYCWENRGKKSVTCNSVFNGQMWSAVTAPFKHYFSILDKHVCLWLCMLKYAYPFVWNNCSCLKQNNCKVDYRMLPWLRVRLEGVVGRGRRERIKEREKITFFLLNLPSEFSLSPRDARKRCVFFSPLTCWVVYGGYYLTLIAAQAFCPWPVYATTEYTHYCTSEET